MEAFKRTIGLSRASEGAPSMLIVDNPNLLNGDRGPPLIEEVPAHRDLAEDPAAQVKDRLISIWNNMKFSKTFWDSKRSISFSRHSPVCLLGQRYHRPLSGSRSRRSSESSEECVTPDSSSMGMDALALDFHSNLWMTYRKDFECFPRTSIDSDCGWGCMIRAGQMIVSNALIRLHLGRDWRWQYHEENKIITGDDIHNEALHRDVVRLFADRTSAPLSIHKIVEIGQSTIQCKPGDWFGPGSTAHLLRQALDLALASSEDRHPQLAELLNMRIYVAMDGTVYKQDVLDLGLASGSLRSSSFGSSEANAADVTGGFSLVERPASRLSTTPPRQCGAAASAAEESQDEVGEEAVFLDDEVRQYSLNQEVSVDGETWMTEEFSAPIVEMDREAVARGTSHRPATSWTPVLLLVPVRLGGGEKLNPIYGPCVKAILAHGSCVGIIGGRPRHALYFVGFHEDNLIHLDPHVVQDTVDVDRTNFPLASFHCRSLRKMPLSKMDPSCCLGFLCKTRQEFQSWCESVATFGSSDYHTFSIVEGRVSDMADSVRLLNQMSMLDDGGDDDPYPQGRSLRRASRSSPSLGTRGGEASSDSDDFVVL